MGGGHFVGGAFPVAVFAAGAGDPEGLFPAGAVVVQLAAAVSFFFLCLCATGFVGTALVWSEGFWGKGCAVCGLEFFCAGSVAVSGGFV